MPMSMRGVSSHSSRSSSIAGLNNRYAMSHPGAIIRYASPSHARAASRLLVPRSPRLMRYTVSYAETTAALHMLLQASEHKGRLLHQAAAQLACSTSSSAWDAGLDLRDPGCGAACTLPARGSALARDQGHPAGQLESCQHPGQAARGATAPAAHSRGGGGTHRCVGMALYAACGCWRVWCRAAEPPWLLSVCDMQSSVQPCRVAQAEFVGLHSKAHPNTGLQVPL